MKPTLYTITPFDATADKTISFSWSGIYQASNKIEIRERDSDDTSTPVFTDVYASFKGKHVIPANSLENGKVYKARIRIETYAGDTNTENEPSEYSDNVIFYCFATPVFGFEGLKTAAELAKESATANQISASSIALAVSYTQESGEELNTWNAYLCDTSYSILQQTDTLYYASKQSTYFSGLDDKANLYVRGTGTTVNGMSIDTGYIPIYVYYGLPGTFINFEAENNDDGGHVDLKSFMVSLQGTSGTGKDITYVGSDALRAAQLTDNYVEYGSDPDNDGRLEVNDDFTLYFKAKDIKVISRNYTGQVAFPSSGINEDSETLGEILLYNEFLALTDSATGYRYSFTLWKTDLDDVKQYQIFMYYNEPDNEFGLWSTAFEQIPDGYYLYLLVQRSGRTFTLKTLIKED